MCGICGVFNFDPSHPVSSGRLRLMTGLMAHRGPDGDGFHIDKNVGLGHRRLATVDLSPSGRQPMSSEDGRYWIVLDGEIHNYLELRRELEARGLRFRSGTDTEVLLRMFERDGASCLDRLDGMFAFAVWDRVKRRLFLARDPFGVKPVYYASTPRAFIFASEIKSILGYRGQDADISLSALGDYLTFHYVIGEETLFSGIRKLEPGHYAWVAAGETWCPRRYWQPPPSSIDIDAGQAADNLHRLLTESVNRRLRADVPVGCTLSGGLDSASICASAAAQGVELPAFTAGFREGGIYDDTETAGLSANRVAGDHHVMFPTHQDFVRYFQKLIWHLDEPVAGDGAFAQFMIAKYASQHVKVMLGGQGADELLGGYVRYYALLLDSAERSAAGEIPHQTALTCEELRRGFRQLAAYRPMMRRLMSMDAGASPSRRYLSLITRQTDFDDLLHPDLRAQLRQQSSIEKALHVIDAVPERDLLDKLLRYDLMSSLPALLQVEDRTATAWSVESRVPFLSRELANFCLTLPAKLKLREGRLKYLLRAAFANRLPSRIVDRPDKIGFPVPLYQWLSGPLREWLHALLFDRRTLERGIFSESALRRAIKPGDPFDTGLWGIICLETWNRLFIDGGSFDMPAASRAISPTPSAISSKRSDRHAGHAN